MKLRRRRRRRRRGGERENCNFVNKRKKGSSCGWKMKKIKKLINKNNLFLIMKYAYVILFKC